MATEKLTTEISTDYSGEAGAAFKVFGSTNAEQEIETRFTYRAPSGDQPQRYVALRAEAKALAHSIIRYCPPSRERELALTKLDEVVMFANAAIARRE